MKYVILGGSKVLIVHDDIPHDLVRSLPGEPLIQRAGFCSLEKGLVQVWGKSVGLGLEARPDDAEIIAEELGLTVHPVPLRI